MGWCDEWPVGLNGEEYDGKHFLTLARDNASPFKDVWNVQLLIDEIEEKLQVKVIDIPTIDKGSNNYVRVCSWLSSGRLMQPCDPTR